MFLKKISKLWKCLNHRDSGLQISSSITAHILSNRNELQYIPWAKHCMCSFKYKNTCHQVTYSLLIRILHTRNGLKNFQFKLSIIIYCYLIVLRMYQLFSHTKCPRTRHINFKVEYYTKSRSKQKLGLLSQNSI